jgi:hypothetical protein
MPQKTKTKRSSSSSLLFLNDEGACARKLKEREREREVTSVGETAASCLFLETSTTPHAARKAKLMDEQNAKDAAVRFFITFFGVFSSSQC